MKVEKYKSVLFNFFYLHFLNANYFLIPNTNIPEVKKITGSF